MPKEKSSLSIRVITCDFTVVELEEREYTYYDTCECGDEDCEEREEYNGVTDEVSTTLEESSIYAIETHNTKRGTIYYWTNLETGVSFTSHDTGDLYDCSEELKIDCNKLDEISNSFKDRAKVYNSIVKKPTKACVEKNVLSFIGALND